jgi:hypothetical protein
VSEAELLSPIHGQRGPVSREPERRMKSAPFPSIAILIFLAVVLPLSVLAYDLPDPKLTPGAINQTVTQTNIRWTICRKGWTRTIRPPVSYTNRLKRVLMRRYGVSAGNLHDFELDHLVPLGLGGAPDDPANLWPQPRTGTWNAELKDDLERTLNRRVCEGRVSLADAQKAIRTDWIAAYRNYGSRKNR